MQGYDLTELLKYINPSTLDYQEWVNVGMALKEEGYTASDWDSWSRNDARYKSGECFRKWGTFTSSGGSLVTGGTIYEYAKRGGFVPPQKNTEISYALSWDDTIVKDDLTIVDSTWLEEREIEEPDDSTWNPVHELITYLQTLFQSTENVGYVTEVYNNEDKLSPKKGNWDRTAGQLIEELRKYNDISSVFGDSNPEAGAWIRFNPLDGNGIKNDNVTDYRYALVESDTVSLGKQNAIMRELEIPIACMVYSGKKSVHAIVKVEAQDYQEYKKRVEYLYKVCEKNGLKVDTQNKNPSRLSRMPGIRRGEHKQFLIATNVGKSNWSEWYEWIEGVNDDLPDPEELTNLWDDIPPLADCLIDNVLRQGHKMLLAGPSKAGKSFALIELTIAIAEGKKWLGFQCAKGKVLYINLELDRASCLHRFADVYKDLGYKPDNLKNIDIWNLRGKAVPMDMLAPKLIRRSEKKGYTAIILDPIYKVITGDENSADQMAKFCNQFDKICTELHSAVIYCHHHSKGAQGGKRSMDRASGSGVFARDPDALLDLIELELTDDIKKAENGKARIRGIEKALNEYLPGWSEEVGQDDRLSPSAMQDFATGKLNFDQSTKMIEYIAKEQEHQSHITAWRIEGTLREFPSFKPLNFWFDYPVHKADESGVLADINTNAETSSWQKKSFTEKFAKTQKEKGEETYKVYIDALEELFDDSTESITAEELSGVIGKSEDVIRKDFCGDKFRGKERPRLKNKLKKAGYVYEKGKISKELDIHLDIQNDVQN